MLYDGVNSAIGSELVETNISCLLFPYIFSYKMYDKYRIQMNFIVYLFSICKSVKTSVYNTYSGFEI